MKYRIRWRTLKGRSFESLALPRAEAISTLAHVRGMGFRAYLIGA